MKEFMTKLIMPISEKNGWIDNVLFYINNREVLGKYEYSYHTASESVSLFSVDISSKEFTSGSYYCIYIVNGQSYRTENRTFNIAEFDPKWYGL